MIYSTTTTQTIAIELATLQLGKVKAAIAAMEALGCHLESIRFYGWATDPSDHTAFLDSGCKVASLGRKRFKARVDGRADCLRPCLDGDHTAPRWRVSFTAAPSIAFAIQ